MLPPKQSCSCGNACLTWDTFATDATHQPELAAQLDATQRLVRRRQDAFQARFGTEMSEDNVWLHAAAKGSLPARHPAGRRADPLDKRFAVPAPSTPARPPVTDQLTRAAKTRHDSATGKAEAALRAMSTQRLPVTFAAVARRAGVSTDFLHRHPTLRSTITSMRSSTVRVPEPRPEAEATDSTSAAVRALAAKAKDLTNRHRAKVAALEHALAAAHGENLLLRRKLAAYKD